MSRPELDRVERALAGLRDASVLRMVLDVDEERARRRAVDAADGPLAGLPFVVKANTAVAGLRHDAGSPLLDGRRADDDARLLAIGSVVERALA